MRLSGRAGRAYTIQASSDLVNWTVLGVTNTTTGILEMTDPANLGRRFYRALSGQ